MRLPALTLVLVSLTVASPPAQGARPRPLRIIVFGTAPNDAETQTSGVVARWVAQGAKVKFVTMTHGVGYVENELGQWPIAPEVKHCAGILDIESQVFDRPPRTLTGSIEDRRTVARLIRQWHADIVIGPRPDDAAPLSHPVDRLARLLNDSATTVVEPFFLPDTPPLQRSPIYVYYFNEFYGDFTNKYYQRRPFDPTIVAGFDNVAKRKWKCVMAMPLEPSDLGGDCGGCQLPSTSQVGDARWSRLDRVKQRDADVANRYRERLVALYGAERGRKVKYAEAFRLSTYGRQATVDELLQMFPK
jgi:hypothetical protein